MSEPDQIDMMNENELRTELRTVVLSNVTMRQHLRLAEKLIAIAIEWSEYFDCGDEINSTYLDKMKAWLKREEK